MFLPLKRSYYVLMVSSISIGLWMSVEIKSIFRFGNFLKSEQGYGSQQTFTCSNSTIELLQKRCEIYPKLTVNTPKQLLSFYIPWKHGKTLVVA